MPTRGYGATSASALLGARIIDSEGHVGEDMSDSRVTTGVLLALAGKSSRCFVESADDAIFIRPRPAARPDQLAGTGGENLTPFAAEMKAQRWLTHLDSVTLALAPDDPRTPHVRTTRNAGQNRRDRRHRVGRETRLRHRSGLAGNPPAARREYPAHGLPYLDFADAVGSLAEACTVIRRLWTENEPFDFDGTYIQLTGAFGNPKPVQRPHPPIMIGGRTTAALRVLAENADLWNIPAGDLEDCVRRGALLDRLCAEIGRDPGD